MSRLILLLPPRRSQPQWQWTGPTAAMLDYLQLGADGQVLAHASARIEQLPAARQVLVIIAACDVLVVPCRLPPVSTGKLTQLLPGLLEEHLLQEPEQLIFALDPSDHGQSERAVAAIDKAWLLPLQQALGQAGMNQISWTAGQYLLSPATASDPDQVEVIMRSAGPVEAERHQPATGWYELWIRRGRHRYGQLLQADQVAAALAQLSSQSLPAATIHSLEIGSASLTVGQRLSRQQLADRAWSRSLSIGAGQGLNSRSGSRGWSWARYRIALRWLWASLACIVLGSYLEAWRLQRQENQLRAEMIEVLHSAAPQIKVVLDPALQLHQQYLAQNASAGHSSSDPFLHLAASASQALDNPSRQALLHLGFDPQGLHLQFKPSADAEALSKQWQHSGLKSIHDADTLIWTLEPSHAD